MNYETTVVDLSGAPEVTVIDTETRPGRRRLIIGAAVVLLLAVAAVLFYLGGNDDEKPFQARKGQQVPTVTVITAGRGTIQGMISATGSLAARVTMPVSALGEGGRVVSVNVEPGQWVGAGQILAVIDRSVQVQQAASSAANIQVARADATLAQANLDRALKLVDRGFISKADVDRLTATRDGARARVAVAEAQYRQLLATNARLNIVAPAGGLVLSRNVQPGQVVGGGGATPLFTIAKGGQMELLANMNEDDLAAVSVGSSATVTPVGSDHSFAGQIWQKSPIIDPQTRQGTARVALPYDPAIRPGGFASAQIARGAVVAPMLPESAVMSDEKGSFVYVVGRDNKVQRRDVKTGLVTNQGIVIVGGLSGSERVVERAGGFLNPGDKVRPANEGARAQAK
jgi:RND family efflux transporter MFP subunit